MRRELGFVAPPPSPIQIVKGLLWVMGLAGPTLIAVDQVDGVISAKASGGAEFGGTADFTALLSGGLLDLARSTGRGMLVLTCLPGSWSIIKDDGPAPLAQSFTTAVPLRLAQSGTFVRRLIAERLAPAYAKAAITPTTPTWPFTDAAILSAAAGTTPRTILMRCDEHRRRCLAEGKVLACDTLVGGPVPPPPPPPRADLDHAYAPPHEAAPARGLSASAPSSTATPSLCAPASGRR